jgi:hypothetical protein
VRVVGDEEAAHVAQHHQDVLVHGVDVKQVVLHLANDMAKHPEVAPKHRGLVHQPHRMGDALRLLQDLQKGGAVHRVGPEGGIHHRARVVEGAQRAGRQAFDTHRGLVEQEGFQDGVGLALVKIVAGHLQRAAFFEKTFVDRAKLVVGGGLVAEPLLDVEQQNVVELGHCLGGPVVAAHQQLAGAAQALGGAWRFGVVGPVASRHHHRRDVGFEAKRFGHHRLQIEHQAVFAPAGQQMQPGADQAEQRLIGLDLARLQWRRQAFAGQLVPAVTKPSGFGHPEDDLQIAQAARRLLDVGFQRVGRVFKLVVALAHFQRFGDEKGLGVHSLFQLLHQPIKQRFAAADQAAFEQRGLHRDVSQCLAHAVFGGAHSGADLQAHVPAGANKNLQALLEGGVFLGLHAVGHQHQHIDIRKRKQLTAPVAAHGQQRIGRFEAGALPERA